MNARERCGGCEEATAIIKGGDWVGPNSSTAEGPEQREKNETVTYGQSRGRAAERLL